MLNDANKEYDHDQDQDDYPNYEENEEDKDKHNNNDQSSDIEAEFNTQNQNNNNNNNNINQNPSRNKENKEKKDNDENLDLRESQEGLEDQNPNPEKLTNLITLNYISVCQYCKENFNSVKNVPYLLKCGHFFCKSCILNNFTNKKNQIICPDDGSKASSLSELKILNNLITNSGNSGNNNESANINRASVNNYVDESDNCKLHPTQKLSHFVEDTKELICVYCAFNMFKKNPHVEIKEISEKCLEVTEDLGKIFLDNQEYLEVIQDNITELQIKKKDEDKKVINLFDSIISFLEEKRKEALEGIQTIFSQNAHKLNEKQNLIISKMEQTESLKLSFENVLNSNAPKFFEVNSKFKNFLAELNSQTSNNFDLNEFKFVHEDTNKLMRYITNFADLKTKQKIISFAPKHFQLKRNISNVPSINNLSNNINNIANSNINSHINSNNISSTLNNNTNLSSGLLRKPYEDPLLASNKGKIQSNKPKEKKPHQVNNINDVLDTSEFANEYNYEENTPKINERNIDRNNDRNNDRNVIDKNTNPMQIQKNYNTEFSSNIDRLKKDLNKFNLGNNIQSNSNTNLNNYGGAYESNLTSNSSNNYN